MTWSSTYLLSVTFKTLKYTWFLFLFFFQTHCITVWTAITGSLKKKSRQTSFFHFTPSKNLFYFFSLKLHPVKENSLIKTVCSCLRITHCISDALNIFTQFRCGTLCPDWSEGVESFSNTGRDVYTWWVVFFLGTWQAVDFVRREKDEAGEGTMSPAEVIKRHVLQKQ